MGRAVLFPVQGDGGGGNGASSQMPLTSRQHSTLPLFWEFDCTFPLYQRMLRVVIILFLPSSSMSA